ncbi:hypothetical protein PoB_003533300 [Plakobranchus ocellatus]|uniref:Uncharacterized protein n=1 Tax=Plakobranchus ocellatus TaxID=259542 RepID=A0AAV4AND6_9GAST|nr:hypothetical protein PoB_003533300 [Plakobranchus ocellatus]
MYGTTLVVLKLLLGIITAQKPTPTVKPTVTIVTNSSSFLCSEHFLVVGEDFVTFELDLSGNNSEYILDRFDGPRFRLHKTDWKNRNKIISDLICVLFRAPQDGFCVKRDIINSTGCSCEVVGPQVYRLKLVYRIHEINETRGRILLLWPSTLTLNGKIDKYYNLPEVRGSTIMYGTTVVVLKLLLGIITAQQPTVTIVTNSSSFSCSENFFVVGEDFVIFELDLSNNNNPDYVYDLFDGPRFRIQKKDWKYIKLAGSDLDGFNSMGMLDPQPFPNVLDLRLKEEGLIEIGY